jgi:hypothetical protein
MDGFDERLLKGLAKQSSNWDLIQSMYEDWMGIKPPRPEPKLALIDLDYSAAERRVQAMFDESSLDPFNWDNLVMRNWLSSESPLSPSAVTRRLFPEGDKTVTGRSTRRFPLQHLPRLTEEKIMKSPENAEVPRQPPGRHHGGDTTNQAAFEERCVKPPLGCGEFLAKKNPFPTPAYKREYRITGMCSPCPGQVPGPVPGRGGPGHDLDRDPEPAQQHQGGYPAGGYAGRVLPRGLPRGPGWILTPEYPLHCLRVGARH